jgi:hypothetical protein
MYYIHTIASITHQDSFQQANVWDALTPLTPESTLITPDYKLFIPPAALRRLSPILRMAIAAAKSCQENSEDQIDAISIGTALGCLTDTEKFLVTFHSAQSDTLSPTAFIQSTHNTIGGQISLDLKNHSYNMTHTQNGLSFEVALMDAILCADDGKKAVLVGSADEAIGFLKQLQPDIIQDNRELTSGTTCCILSRERKASSIGIVDCLVRAETSDWQTDISDFLDRNEMKIADIDAVFVSQPEDVKYVDHAVCYIDYTGLYYSASAFAVHMAYDKLTHTDAKTALIINRVCGNQLGAILLQKDEAPH